MKPRSLAVLGAIIATVAGLVLPATTPTAVASSPRGHTAAASTEAAASGSYLALVDRGPDAKYGGIRTRTQRLVLVWATGEVRTVYRHKVTGPYGAVRLLDWSADERTALLISSPPRGARVFVVDVGTGATRELSVPLLASAVLDPAGTGILATSWASRTSNRLVLDRIAWDGGRTRLLDSTTGAVTPGRNGTVLSGDGRKRKVQLLLSTTDGAVVRRIRTEGFCSPVRWWDDTRLLEACGSGLVLLDPATGTTQQLTKARGFAHLDARQVGDRLFVEVAGGCGYRYVGRITRKGQTRHLRVPGAVGSVVMVDAVEKELVLQHEASCDGDRPRSVLSLFDPVHHEETPLVVLGRHEVFGQVLVGGEVRGSTY